MNLMEMRDLLEQTLVQAETDPVSAVKVLNEKFSNIALPSFHFRLSRPAISEKWVAIALPRIGIHRHDKGEVAVKYADIDINMTMFERGIFAGNKKAVAAVIASIIYKNIFDLDGLRSIQEYAAEVHQNLIFSGNETDEISEHNFIRKLLKEFPMSGILLFTYPRIFEIENDEVRKSLSEFKKITSEFDLYDYRFDTRSNELTSIALLNYIATQVFNGNKAMSWGSYNARNTFKMKSYDVEIKQMSSMLIKGLKSIESRFQLFAENNEAFWKLNDEKVNFLEFLNEGFMDGKINYLNLERSIDIMMSEIPDIKSLSDKQALIDIVYDNIGRVQNYMSKHSGDKMAQDILERLYDVRNLVRDALINKRKSILTVTYPDGYSG